MPGQTDLTLIFGLAADLFLAVAAAGAAVYCMILARRLKRFNTLENGVGGAVAVLSAQVDDMTRTLDQARKSATESAATLTGLTERAEESARKLELMMASLHDLPDTPSPPAQAAPDSETPDVSREAEKIDEDETPLFSSRRSEQGAAA